MEYSMYKLSDIKKKIFYADDMIIAKIVKTKSKLTNQTDYNVKKLGVFIQIDDDKFLHLTSGIVFESYNKNAENCEYYVLLENSHSVSSILKDDYVKKTPFSFEAVEFLEDEVNKVWKDNKNNDQFEK